MIADGNAEMTVATRPPLLSDGIPALPVVFSQGMSPAPPLTRQALLAAERGRLDGRRHGALRVCLAYPNTYHVAMSSLAFQWLYELTLREEGVGVERAVADDHLLGRTLESDASLADFDVVAFSLSFELDAVNVVRLLEAAGIPARREQRTSRHPLVVVGGAVATINPLPLARAVDVFCLGSAERVWAPLLQSVAASPDRGEVLAALAGRDGYFVPAHHLDPDERPRARLRRLEKRAIETLPAAEIPASCRVTPHTEYADRALVEMSRGCPEKCRYCWVSFNYGKLACYPAAGILERIDQLAAMTDRVGLVATAVGDHPALADILARSVDRGVNVALSSLRIPAMTEAVLAPLAASGARSVTIAPETGTDELRRRMGKPIPNAAVLAAVETAQRVGIANLKAYFIVGFPDESDRDLDGIVELVAAMQRILRAAGRARGRLGAIQVGISLLVPKPYTPFKREAMLDEREARRRLDRVLAGLVGIANVKATRPSHREAVWQGYLSRGDASAYELVEAVAHGLTPSRLHRDHRQRLAAATLAPIIGDPVWQFISSAPTSVSPEP